MSTLRTLSGRPELRAAAVALLLLAALALALAAAAPAAALALALAGAAAALLGVAAAAARPHAPARRRAAAPAGDPGPTLRLTLPDGATVSARPVALPGEARERLLLTRDGYVLVDEAGRVIHRL